MQQGFFRLEHKSIGKLTHVAGTAGAHARYILRRSACEKILTVNFSRLPQSIVREIEEYEEAAGARARLLDKLIISFDKRMSLEHREEAVNRFNWILSGYGKGRVVASFHETHGENPHVHIAFIEKDGKGKSIHNLGANRTYRARKGLEPNVTIWLRKLWENVCNDVLERHGYGFRIDQRSNFDRGLSTPQERLPPTYLREPENDNTPPKIIRDEPKPPDTPPVAPTRAMKPRKISRRMWAGSALRPPRRTPWRPQMHLAPLPVKVEFQPTPIQSVESPMAEVVPLFPETPVIQYELPPLKTALKADDELQELQTARESRRAAREAVRIIENKLAEVNAQIAKTTTNFNDVIGVLANRSLKLKRKWGILKPGFRVFRWRSPKRHRFDDQQLSYKSANSLVQDLRDELTRRLADKDVFVKQREETLQAVKDQDVYGTDEEMADAEKMLKATIEHNLRDVDQAKVLAAQMDGAITPDEMKRLNRMLPSPDVGISM